MIGIYKITIDSRYYYIGSCIDFEKRKKLHFYQLERGKHHNRRMQILYDKGYEFDMQFIESVERDVLYDREEELIVESWDDPSCVNLSKSTTNPLYERTPESLAKQMATKARRGDWGGANENSWAAAAKVNTGIKRSKEARGNMSDAKKSFLKDNPDFYNAALDKGRANRWEKHCKSFYLVKEGVKHGPFKKQKEAFHILSSVSISQLYLGKKDTVKDFSLFFCLVVKNVGCSYK